jgi:hypothetical protein
MKYFMLSEDEIIQLANGKLDAKDIGMEKEIIYAITIADVVGTADELGINPKKAIAIARKRIIDAIPSLDEIIKEEL